MADTSSSSSTGKRGNVDRGWAYVVLFAVHGFYFIYAGHGKSLGVLLPTLKEQFDTQTWLLGSIISIESMIKDLSAIPAAVLSRKLTMRWILIGGSTVACCGMILASVARTIIQLAICMSGLTGLGFGFCFPLMQTTLGQYFHKKYACATGVSLAGLSFGIMAMTPLTQVLLDVYGWRGAVLIFGGISLNLVGFTALARPLARRQVLSDVEAASTDPERNSTQGHPSGAQSQRDETRDERRRSPVRSLLIRPAATVNSGMKKFVKASDVSLFKEFSFLVVVIICCSVRFTYSAWTIYFVPRAIDMGFGKYEVSLLVTINGIGSLVGKIFNGPLIDRKVVSRRVLLGLSMFVSATVLALDRCMVTVPAMAAGQCVLGTSMGISGSLFLVIMRRVARIQRLANSLAWASVASAAVRLMAGFVPGYIYDQTNNYDHVFLVMAIATIVGPLVLTVEAGVNRFCKKKKISPDARWECVLADADSTEQAHCGRAPSLRTYTTQGRDMAASQHKPY